jgi:hypothetical protein
MSSAASAENASLEDCLIYRFGFADFRAEVV